MKPMRFVVPLLGAACLAADSHSFALEANEPALTNSPVQLPSQRPPPPATVRHPGAFATTEMRATTELGTNTSNSSALLSSQGQLSTEHPAPVAEPPLELLKLSARGAVADFAAHKAAFPVSPTDDEPVTVTVPSRNGDLTLKSKFVGIGYWDIDSGETTLFAWPRTAAGRISGSTISYGGAMEGTDGDITYSCTHSSFDQSIVLHKQLPDASALGMNADASRLRLVVITEFIDPPLPITVSAPINLVPKKLELNAGGPDELPNDTLFFGSMRMGDGKSFRLGDSSAEIPTGKKFVNVDGHWLLLEFSPLPLVQALLSSLPAGTLHASTTYRGELKSALAQLRTANAARKTAEIKRPRRAIEVASASNSEQERPGVVLDYLLTSTRLINVKLGLDTKAGFGAVGNGPQDYWTGYYHPSATVYSLTNLKWSDTNSSTVGLVVTNAPGHWGQPSRDPLMDGYIYSWGGNVKLIITNLPANVYNFYVYGHQSAVAANSVFNLYRAGTLLDTKGTTLYGTAWRTTNYEPGIQYVVFQNVAVTNQTMVIDIPPGGDGLPYINGLQIVESAAVPPSTPGITNLISINCANISSSKTGYAAIGLSSTDSWNLVVCDTPVINVTNLLTWNGTNSGVSLALRAAQGNWGNSIPDEMYSSYTYNISVLARITNLWAGNYDFYVYGHAGSNSANSVFKLWTGDRDCDTRATSVWGNTWNSTNWSESDQFCVFHDVAVESNDVVMLSATHGDDTYGVANLNGIQIVYKGPSDTNSNRLPDAWEKYQFGSTSQSATNDVDGDLLTNRREYELDLDPTLTDTDRNGIDDTSDSTVTWIQTELPRGAVETEGIDPSDWIEAWDWWWEFYDGDWYVYSDAGVLHLSNLPTETPVHEHGFESATVSLTPRHGDLLFADINIDPANPPAEIMLQWQTIDDDGSFSWEHRAYWGSNTIPYLGINNTASRRYVTNCPAANEWIRLTVPASAVGLEGRPILGMMFTLYGGRAAWSGAGKTNPDQDGNLLGDEWENAFFGHIGNDPAADPDGDGLTNLQEYQNSTSPVSGDTDADGVSDRIEIIQGRNPRIAGSISDTNNLIKLQVYTPLN